MATYTITESVHVDIRVNGEDFSGSYGPGDVDLPQPVADHLVAVGLATKATATKKASAKSTPEVETPEN